MENVKILAFGEVMMRLDLPDYQLLEQTNHARFTFTGTGVNVLSGMAHLGYTSYLLTALPDNRVGVAARANLRKLGIQDQWIKYHGSHIGTYVLEQGYGNRPSEVTYLDRIHSSFNEYLWSEDDIQEMLAEVDVVHICGIALSLDEKIQKMAQFLAEEASKMGKIVCFDFNYRSSLNNPDEKAQLVERYRQFLPYCQIVFGGQRDLVELLGLAEETGTTDFETLCRHFSEKYQLTCFAGTIRSQKGKELQGFCFMNDQLTYSKKVPLQIYDRIGAGDAYTVGILAGVLEEREPEYMVNFAVSSAAYAHTTLGDSPIATREQIIRMMEEPDRDIIR